MRRAGRERTVDALFSSPQRLSAKTILYLFPDLDRKAQEEKAYRIYITDALKILGHMNIRYVDMLNGDPNELEETRSDEDIKAHICELLEKMEPSQ